MSSNKLLYTQEQIKKQTFYATRCIELQLGALFARVDRDILGILAIQIERAYTKYPRIKDSDTTMVSILNATGDVNGTYRLSSVLDDYFAKIVKSIHDKHREIDCGTYTAEDFVAEIQKNEVWKRKFFTESKPLVVREEDPRTFCLG